MKNSYCLILIFLLFALSVSLAQSTIDTVLSGIESNNKSIVVNRQYWEAKKLEYQTDLMPYNPKVEYEFLNGSPDNAGNQTDFSIVQSFDFPTAYFRKRELSDEKTEQAQFSLSMTRRDVLLEAKLICIELVYRNKLQSKLSARKQTTEKWLTDFQRLLDLGEGTIMDVNKAKLQLITINTAFQENTSITNQLNQKLAELNGGIPVLFLDTIYLSPDSIPDFETLEEAIDANDPFKKYLQQETLIARKEIELSKAMALPKFEAGYRYQSILGQTFQGIHLGLTIPLWENKNKVDAKRAALLFEEANLQDHINEQYYDIKQKYEELTNLKTTLDEYQTLFSSLNNVKYLDKSLSLGQISTITYFNEMTFYYEAQKNYLKIEMEYHKVVAELYKYQL